MSFLNALSPLLKNGASINFNIKEVNGQVQIVIEPRIGTFDADTSDEVVAALQAALVHPIRLLTEKNSTDEQLIEALTGLTPVYEATTDQLADYRQRLADAAAEAKRKADEKAASKPSKVSSKPKAELKAPATSSGEGADAAKADDDGEQPVEASQPASPATANFNLF